ncbi:MAG: hypothetical protein ABI868_02950 [Acidobacteriota bacterium]
MDNRNAHLSDHDLLLAVDDELRPSRAIAVGAHLARCADCRRRKERLEDTARAFARAYHEHDVSPPAATAAHDDARRRLEAALTRVRPVGRWSWSDAGAALAAAALVILALRAASPRQPDQPAPVAEAEPGALPLPQLTPGDVRPVTLDELCAERLPSGRSVPPSVQQAVLHDYNMGHLREGDYELDHLITPALGGTSDRRNLWPERYGSRVWNARVKDELEDLLPQLVCERKVPLATAQREIASNWITAYKKYFRTDRPLPSRDRM